MANSTISQIKVGNTTYDICDAIDRKDTRIAATAVQNHVHQITPTTEIWDTGSLTKSVSNITLTTIHTINTYDMAGAWDPDWNFGNTDTEPMANGIIFAYVTFTIPKSSSANGMVSAVLTNLSNGDITVTKGAIRASNSSSFQNNPYYQVFNCFSYVDTPNIYFRLWHNCGSTQTITYNIKTFILPFATHSSIVFPREIQYGDSAPDKVIRFRELQLTE